VSTPELLDYLKKENEYFNRDTAHLESFRESLYKEMRSRIKEDDRSLPLFKNGFWYQSEYREGKEYPIYSRFKNENGEGKELLFDVNELASAFSYYHFKGLKVSPNNELALYAEDTVSRRQYTLKIKNLETGQLLDDVIENTTGTACWASQITKPSSM
jgi:oligopeptidase B